MMGQKPAKLTKPWADHPFKLVESPNHKHNKKFALGTATQFANEMALVHVSLIRAINSIYLQAPNIKEPKDIKDFSTFMHAWCEVIHDHHHNEEEYFFPWIEEYIGIPGYMQVNVDQHHEFEPGKLKFEAYVKGLREGTETYDGQRVRRLIDDFAPTLAQHLSDEIVFLVGLEKFEKIDWTAVNKRVTDFALKHTDAEYAIPMILASGDIRFEKGFHEHYWPPYPFFVGWMFKYWYAPKHKDAWRFGCSDLDGNPKDLPFVDEKA